MWRISEPLIYIKQRELWVANTPAFDILPLRGIPTDGGFPCSNRQFLKSPFCTDTFFGFLFQMNRFGTLNFCITEVGQLQVDIKKKSGRQVNQPYHGRMPAVKEIWPVLIYLCHCGLVLLLQIITLTLMIISGPINQLGQIYNMIPRWSIFHSIGRLVFTALFNDDFVFIY